MTHAITPGITCRKGKKKQSPALHAALQLKRVCNAGDFLQALFILACSLRRQILAVGISLVGSNLQNCNNKKRHSCSYRMNAFDIIPCPFSLSTLSISREFSKSLLLCSVLIQHFALPRASPLLVPVACHPDAADGGAGLVGAADSSACRPAADLDRLFSRLRHWLRRSPA